MKTLNKLFLAFMLVGSFLTFSSCDKDNGPDVEQDEDTLEVMFESASLAAFIREELGLAANAPITREDLRELTNLTIRGTLDDVTSLSGLEYATELTVVDFGGNPVTDLTPISGLRKVAYLRMNNTGVTNLSPVSEYTTLTYFNANQASPGISDLSPLSGNLGMQTMILRAQPIGNEGLAAISDFTNLYRLNIRATGVTDLSVIADLMSRGAFLNTTPGAGDLGSDPALDLQQLEIDNCEVLDPYRGNLAGEIDGACRVATPPTASQANIPDANLLAHIKARLGLGENDVVDTENILALTTIESSSEFPGGNFADITDLTGLQDAVNLERINLHQTKVADITPLKDLEKVTYLRFSETDVTDLSALSEYTTLTYFNANRGGQSSGGITTLEPLSKNVDLQELIVRGNHLGNSGADVVKNFTKLHRLNLRQTSVTAAIVVDVVRPLMDAGALLRTTSGFNNDSEVALQGNGISAADLAPIQSYIDAGTAVPVSR